MSYLTLFSDDKSWLATDKKVIPAKDFDSTESAASLMASLSRRQIDAEAELQRIKEAAESSGHTDGFEVGRAAASEQNDLKLSDLQQLFRDENQRRDDQAIEFALAVVRRIAGNVANEAWLAAQAREAVRALNRPEELVRLVVHRSQLDAVTARLEEYRQAGDAEALRIHSVDAADGDDTELCRLEVSVGGSVIIDLNTQLKSIGRALTRVDHTEVTDA